ncbi:Uncharacterised protein [uncultured archaeon]|nr:Uncharacterised protein [uncultured archaeon]
MNREVFMGLQSKRINCRFMNAYHTWIMTFRVKKIDKGKQK